MTIRTIGTAKLFHVFMMFVLAGLLSVASAEDWMDYGDAMVPEGTQKVTFIELGANRCLPCRMMQPILKTLEERYPQDLKVVFIDVWKENGEIAGKKYQLRSIPTQIFYNAQGEEIFRHEGFFAQKQIEDLLKKQGVTQ
ncbi:thiol reductase thioredoxin [Hydrogenovibrio sp. SC-1]|uniref:thioredoxin family protein n=1 Tax=Hydrogenovibrio sp. SC-1 TaxID=2065820 RepID=UPI000C7CBD00|nr:thioredoxin family protein [Hydrogenovibrio sp. SC-1]PLA75238.1 thiol reductase thioredoxin [Hydrogenovibrio sp. SC-1]